MIPIVISFFCGILSFQNFSTLPSIGAVSMAVAVMTIIVLFQRRQNKISRVWVKLIWVFLLGFLWCLLQAKNILDKRIPEDLEQKVIEVVGMVDSMPVVQDKGIQFEFKIVSTLPTYLWASPGRVMLHAPFTRLPIRVGETWQFFVKLKRPHSYANPGSMDIERQFFQKRMVAKGYIVPGKPYQKLKSGGFTAYLQSLRVLLKEKMGEALRDKPFVGVIKALVIGVQDEITPEQWQIFRNTGTSHLMAISGLHIGLVAGFMFYLTSGLYRYLPGQWLKIPLILVAAAGGLAAAVIYALLAGFSIPTQRAIVMISIVMASIFTKRLISSYRIYFLSLGIVLVVDPLSVLLPGFWLSFGAVGILLYGMQGRVKPAGFWYRWGRAQWVVFLGLMPFSFALFDMTSIASPIGNIVAIPWMSLCVVPLSLAGGLLSLISPDLAHIILGLAHQSLSLIMWLLEFMSALPNAALAHATHTPVTLAMACVGVGVLLLPRGVSGKYMGFVWILPLFCIQPSPVAQNTAKVTVLDVGQGLATVVETAHHVLVFDTGPKLSPHFDTGERVVLPFLATRGVKRIDTLVISHNDNDHAGGAVSIVQNIKVNQVITSTPESVAARMRGTAATDDADAFQSGRVAIRNAMPCFAGQQWEWDGVRFSMLHPSGFLSKKNDYACVLKVEAGGQSVLLTGDIEAKSEKILLEKAPQQLSSTVMLVPHHGSKTSSTLPFIQAVNPQYAIIPVGYRNTYGHPKAEVVNRYQQAGITLFNTIEHGAVAFTLGRAGLLETPSAYRVEHKRYWH